MLKFKRNKLISSNKLTKPAKDKYLITNVTFLSSWISSSLFPFSPKSCSQALYTSSNPWTRPRKKELLETLCKALKSNKLLTLWFWNKRNPRSFWNTVWTNSNPIPARFSLVPCKPIWNKARTLTTFSKSLNNITKKSWFPSSKVKLCPKNSWKKIITKCLRLKSRTSRRRKLRKKKLKLWRNKIYNNNRMRKKKKNRVKRRRKKKLLMKKKIRSLLKIQNMSPPKNWKKCLLLKMDKPQPLSLNLSWLKTLKRKYQCDEWCFL